MFALQSRQKIVKSGVNKSVSKQLWTFSKTKRFPKVQAQCPVAFYQQNYSTISNKKAKFSKSKRKVFTQRSDAPLPGQYQTYKQQAKNIPLFGEGRDKCIFSSYNLHEISQNPGPEKYEKSSPPRKKGFSMRPKTANERNYFIDDKERKESPGPSRYFIQIQHQGISAQSRYKSTTLGNFGLRTTQKRFQTYDPKTPGPSKYSPKNVGLVSQTKGGTIGNELRKTFIDRLKKYTNTTGPGSYEQPSEFGHYMHTQSISHSNRE